MPDEIEDFWSEVPHQDICQQSVALLLDPVERFSDGSGRRRCLLSHLERYHLRDERRRCAQIDEALGPDDTSQRSRNKEPQRNSVRPREHQPLHAGDSVAQQFYRFHFLCNHILETMNVDDITMPSVCKCSFTVRRRVNKFRSGCRLIWWWRCWLILFTPFYSVFQDFFKDANVQLYTTVSKYFEN